MADPRPAADAELAALLRSCVQCGLCLPHCATWLATGSEVQSPRGRLLLLEDVLQNDAAGASAPMAYLAAFDQCIGCRACETACPSGVPFTLLEHGQSLARGLVFRSGGEKPAPAVPGFVMRRLDSPHTLRILGRVARATRSLFSVLIGRRWRRRLDQSPAGLGNLARLLGSVPTAPESDDKLCAFLDNLVRKRRAQSRAGAWPVPTASPVADPPPVVFFQGCANRGLLPGPSRRVLDLLRAAGCPVETPAGQDCCGALAAHTARPGRAAVLHHRNRKAFGPGGQAGPLVVVEAAGCGLELKERLGELGSRVTDAVDLLSRLTLPALRPVPLKVAVHDPCHARHGQGIFRQPRELLSRIPGLILVEALEGEVCCGSGGAWGLRYAELSDRLARRKAGHLAVTGADLVVTSNPGCLGQIADGLSLVAPDLPIIPLTDLLWYAIQAD